MLPPAHVCMETEAQEPLPEGDYEPANAPVVAPRCPEATFWQQPAWVAPVAFLAGFVTAVFAVGAYAYFTAASP